MLPSTVSPPHRPCRYCGNRREAPGREFPKSATRIDRAEIRIPAPRERTRLGLQRELGRRSTTPGTIAAEGRNRNQARLRIRLLNGVEPQTSGCEPARLEALEDDIHVGVEGEERCPTGFGFQIENDALLARVQPGEERAVLRRQERFGMPQYRRRLHAPERVSARRLDLDDLRTGIRQKSRREGAGDLRREIKNTKAAERGGHRKLLIWLPV